MIVKKFIVLLCILPLVGFALWHEYYVSITQIDYISDKKVVQITSRLFTDDLESALRQQYGDTLKLDPKKNRHILDDYISRYIKRSLLITINSTPKELSIIGNEFDLDVITCYMEIKDVPEINTLNVFNVLLCDVYLNQENIVRTHINSKYKTFILNTSNTKGFMKF